MKNQESFLDPKVLNVLMFSNSTQTPSYFKTDRNDRGRVSEEASVPNKVLKAQSGRHDEELERRPPLGPKREDPRKEANEDISEHTPFMSLVQDDHRV